MSRKVKMLFPYLEIEAELNDSQTAQRIWEILPIKAETNRWGEEIYFSIPLKLKEENAKEVVEEGDLGFWVSGRCFCIFFGPTPISKPGEIRPASAVNVFGKILGDVKSLSQVQDGEEIRIEKIE